MEYFNIILQQVGFFTTALAVGIVSYRVGFITDELVANMSRLMMKVILPLLVVTVVANSGTRDELFSVWPFALACFGMYFIHIVISYVSGKAVGLKKPEINAHVGSTSFVNSAIIGYPIIMEMFPETSGLYIAAFLVVETFTTWTAGVMILSGANGKGKIDFKKMITPMTVALAIGIVMVLVDIHPQNIVWETLTGIGGIQKYFGLLYIGAVIGQRGLKKLFAKPKVFFTIPVKLLLCPLAVFFIFNMLGLTHDSLIALTVFSMLPTMLVITILSIEHDAAPDYASGAILATTLSSLVTMPLVFYIISFF